MRALDRLVARSSAIRYTPQVLLAMDDCRKALDRMEDKAMRKNKMVHVEIDGRTYEIPDMWICGYTSNGRHTVYEAIQHWHAQALMGEAFRRGE